MKKNRAFWESMRERLQEKVENDILTVDELYTLGATMCHVEEELEECDETVKLAKTEF